MKSYQLLTKYIFALLLMVLVLGCANNKNKSVFTVYEHIDIHKEWESLLTEKEAPEIEFDYDVDTMFFYNVKLSFTPEMMHKLTEIKSVLSVENCNKLEILLKTIGKYHNEIYFITYDSLYLLYSNIMYNIKTINLLALKLLILLWYSDNNEQRKSIIDYIEKDINAFPQEYRILNNLFKKLDYYTFSYKMSLKRLKEHWTGELTNQYLGFSPDVLPNDLLDIDCNESGELESIFNIKKFDWQNNYLLPTDVRCCFDYQYKSFFSKDERDDFLNDNKNDKIDLFYRIQNRILFQQIRLKYFIFKNSLEIKTPEYPKLIFIDNFSKPEYVNEVLNNLKSLFEEWEEFAKKLLETR